MTFEVVFVGVLCEGGLDVVVEYFVEGGDASVDLQSIFVGVIEVVGLLTGVADCKYDLEYGENDDVGLGHRELVVSDSRTC